MGCHLTNTCALPLSGNFTIQISAGPEAQAEKVYFSLQDLQRRPDLTNKASSFASASARCCTVDNSKRKSTELELLAFVFPLVCTVEEI